VGTGGGGRTTRTGTAPIASGSISQWRGCSGKSAVTGVGGGSAASRQERSTGSKGQLCAAMDIEARPRAMSTCPPGPRHRKAWGPRAWPSVLRRVVGSFSAPAQAAHPVMRGRPPPPANSEAPSRCPAARHPPRSRQGSAPKGAKRPFGLWGLGVLPPGDSGPCVIHLRDEGAQVNRRTSRSEGRGAQRGRRGWWRRVCDTTHSLATH